MFSSYSGDPKLSPCGLQALANPQLQGAGPGLQWDENRVQILNQAFPCCAGRGVRDDFEANTSRRCHLNHRLSMVRILMRRFAIVWGADRRFPGFARPSPVGAVDGRQGQGWEALLASQVETESCQGRAVLSPNAAAAEAWPFALAATWRFGIETHVVHLERTPLAEQTLPPVIGNKGQAMVVVEGADRLWDSRSVDRLLALVLVCRNAGYPLWLFATPAAPSGAAARAALRREDARPGGAGGYGNRRPGKFNFDQRLANLRARLPWQWLAQDELALLEQVTAIPESTPVGKGPETTSKKTLSPLREAPKRNKTDSIR